MARLLRRALRGSPIRRSRRFEAGQHVLVRRAGGEIRKAKLVRFDDSTTKAEAWVTYDDVSQERVATYLLMVAPGRNKRGRAWEPIGAIAAVVGAIAAVVALVHLPLGGTAKKTGVITSHGGSAAASLPAHTSSTRSAAPLVPNAASSCASAEAIATSARPAPTFVGSPGQLEGGVNIFEEKHLPGGSYAEVVHATPGDRIEMSVELANGAYGSIQNLVVKVQLVAVERGCWRATASASSKVTRGGNSKFGSVYVLLPKSTDTRIAYEPRSTKLYTDPGRMPVSLKDGIVKDGLPLPYQLTGGTTWFVNFVADVR